MNAIRFVVILLSSVIIMMGMLFELFSVWIMSIMIGLVMIFIRWDSGEFLLCE